MIITEKYILSYENKKYIMIVGSKRIKFLFDSESRLKLLVAIDEKPSRPCELADRLPMSRSAIQRNFKSFVDHGYAEKQNGRYRSTAGGSFILQACKDAIDTAQFVEDSGSVFDSLYDTGLNLTLNQFSDATITVATPHRPHAPMHHYIESVKETSSETVRGILPVFSYAFNDLHRTLLEEGVRSEVVTNETVLDVSLEPDQTVSDKVIDDEQLTIYVYSGPLSFGLSIFDECVFVGGYSNDGQFRVCLESSAVDVYKNAREVYEEYRRDANKITYS